MKKNVFLLLCTSSLILCAIACTSCNVTRVVKTESAYFQRGDTTCTIVTKTTESYDATRKY